MTPDGERTVGTNVMSVIEPRPMYYLMEDQVKHILSDILGDEYVVLWTGYRVPVYQVFPLEEVELAKKCLCDFFEYETGGGTISLDKIVVFDEQTIVEATRVTDETITRGVLKHIKSIRPAGRAEL